MTPPSRAPVAADTAVPLGAGATGVEDDTGGTTHDARWERIGMTVAVAIVLAHAVRGLPGSLWLDEAYTFAAMHDLPRSVTQTHGTMAAYYAVMWAWGLFGSAVWWVRLPSVLFALATLAVTRSIARRIGGPLLAAVAVPLLALVPLFEEKAVEARSYSLMTLLIAVAWYVTLRADAATTARAGRWWWALVPLGVVGALVHGLFAVHLLPVVGVAVLGRRPGVALLRVSPGVVAAGVTAAALHAGGASGVGTHIPGGVGVWTRATVSTLLPGPPLLRLALVATVAAGVAASVLAVVRSSTDRRARAAVPVLWTVGPVVGLMALSLVAPRFNPRYLAPITPGLALCLGMAARELARRAGRHDRRVPVLASGVVGVLVATSFLWTPRVGVEDWAGAARVVADGARAGDGLVFATLENGERPPFEAAWARVGPATAPTVLTSARPLGEVRRYEDDERDLAEVAAAVRSHDRVWVVIGGFWNEGDAIEDLQHPAFSSRTEVGRWTMEGGIEVRLLVRRG